MKIHMTKQCRTGIYDGDTAISDVYSVMGLYYGGLYYGVVLWGCTMGLYYGVWWWGGCNTGGVGNNEEGSLGNEILVDGRGCGQLI